MKWRRIYIEKEKVKVKDWEDGYIESVCLVYFSVVATNYSKSDRNVRDSKVKLLTLTVCSNEYIDRDKSWSSLLNRDIFSFKHL